MPTINSIRKNSAMLSKMLKENNQELTWSYTCPCQKTWYNLISLKGHINALRKNGKQCIDYESAKNQYIANRRKFLGYDPNKKTKIIILYFGGDSS